MLLVPPWLSGDAINSTYVYLSRCVDSTLRAPSQQTECATSAADNHKPASLHNYGPTRRERICTTSAAKPAPG